jgi:FkbM family methyltransferase
MLLLKILNKLKLLHHVNLIGDVTLNGVTFKIPVIKKLGIGNVYMSEPWMISLLKKLKLKDGQFIDVGVNIGQTMLKLKSVNKEIEYIGFEPNPTCVFYSNELIQINQFKKTTIIPTGISNINGILKLDFYSTGLTDPSASIIANFRPNQKVAFSKYIPVNTIDNLSQSISIHNVEAIKIDVEGAELEVIESLRNLISENQPVILIEILPVYNIENKERLIRQQKIETILKELNYSIFRIQIKDNDFESIEPLESIGVHSDLDACEYVFMPKNTVIEGLN